MLDQHDVVGKCVGLLQVLRGQQHGHAVRDQLADGRPNDLPTARIEAGGGLVENQQLRRIDQPGREVDAATLAAGDVLDQLVAELADVETLYQLVDRGERGAAVASA